MAIATKVFFESNPYNIKNMSKQMKLVEWTLEKEKEIMKESMIMKFEEHSILREKLIGARLCTFMRRHMTPHTDPVTAYKMCREVTPLPDQIVTTSLAKC